MKKQCIKFWHTVRRCGCIEFWHEWAWLLIGSALMAIFWGMILNDIINFFSK